jgi:hypothetical protein
MKTLILSILVVVIAATTALISEADADNTGGVCNAIVATDLGAAQACENMSCMPGDDVCVDITNALIEFVTTPGCLGAFQNGELNGLPGNASTQPAGPNAGDTKHIQDVVCGAVEDCGLCPSALVVGICGAACTD